MVTMLKMKGIVLKVCRVQEQYVVYATFTMTHNTQSTIAGASEGSCQWHAYLLGLATCTALIPVIHCNLLKPH